MAITRDRVERFENEGYLSPVLALEAKEAAECRRHFDELESRVGQIKSCATSVDLHGSERFVWDLATNPNILDAVEAIIGPNILLLGTHFVCKYASSETFMAWHQDATYWGLDPALVVSAWYAVDDSDVENGCMRVIPGTHRTGIHEHGKSDRAGNFLRANQETAVSPAEEQRAVDIILRAGEFSLHDGHIIHGSLPNHSSRRRCGLSIRYVPTKVKQSATESHTISKAILVRGEDRERHFAPTAAPFQ